MVGDNIKEVKKKREFSGLPDSVVERALRVSGDDVKKTRALLRKYFGVFLTNRILKNKGDLLKVHLSSRGRDYQKFYEEIFSDSEDVGSVIDFGCGVNGFSYKYLPRRVKYIGVEAAGQIVRLINDFFKEEGFDGRVVRGDLFDIESVLEILRKQKKNRVVFLLQVVDALEGFEKNFSKKFLLEISEECEEIVLSLPTESLGKKKRFAVQRKWLSDFLEENFLIEGDFVLNRERIIVFRKK